MRVASCCGELFLSAGPAAAAVVWCGCAGDLFFTDWSDMDINVRMKYWDRKFKTLLSFPQVGGGWGGGGCAVLLRTV